MAGHSRFCYCLHDHSWVHWSLKPEGMTLSTVLAVSQNSCAGHKNGVKSLHWQYVLLLPFISSIWKLDGCRAHHRIKGFQPVVFWKVQHLCWPQQDNLERQDRLTGCSCALLPDNLNRFWPILQWAPPSNDLTVRSLHHCNLWNRFQHACMCMFIHWHSMEWTDMWICQHSAHFKFLLSTHTHTCMCVLMPSEGFKPTGLKVDIAIQVWFPL